MTILEVEVENPVDLEGLLPLLERLGIEYTIVKEKRNTPFGETAEEM